VISEREKTGAALVISGVLLEKRVINVGRREGKLHPVVFVRAKEGLSSQKKASAP